MVCVVRSSTETVKSPSGTARRYVPVGSLRARNVPPWARVKTTGTGSGKTAPFTVTRPETCVPRTKAIGRSRGPATETVPAKRNVSEPWVRFAYTVYDPGVTYVRKCPLAASTTSDSGPSNSTETLTRFPRNVTDPVTFVRRTMSTSWATDPTPTSRVSRSSPFVCHRSASEFALTFSSTITW